MPPANLFIHNAHIRTMSPTRPLADAMIVSEGRVAAIGTATDLRAKLAAGTPEIDVRGRLVLPGFQDTHIHHIEGGHHYVDGADLSAPQTPKELVDALARYAASTDRDWVFGSFYDGSALHVGNLDRHVLDQAVADRPCLIVSADAHNGCMNSKAIEILGLGTDTLDPPEGQFVRDSAGALTGLLYESAVDFVNKQRPAATDEDYFAGVRFAQSLENSFGITAVLDANINSTFAGIYNRMAERGELTTRVAATASVRPGEQVRIAVERLEKMRREATHPMFRVHSAKFFLDGVIENRTAAMIAPYSDETGGNAQLLFSVEDIKALFTAFDAARFQIHVHAIGDLAVRAALDGMEVARNANGAWPSRHQIAHIQFIDPTDIPRFARLGVVANIQPLWAHHGPSVDDLAIGVVGLERGKYIYAFKSLRNAGAEVVLSSDWTVSTCNPLEIIATAMSRLPVENPQGLPPLLPEQALTIDECVYGYTLGAAKAAWRDDETGSLEPGKWADFIILDRNIFTCTPQEIARTQVVTTYLAGEPVFGGI